MNIEQLKKMKAETEALQAVRTQKAASNSDAIRVSRILDLPDGIHHVTFDSLKVNTRGDMVFLEFLVTSVEDKRTYKTVVPFSANAGSGFFDSMSDLMFQLNLHPYGTDLKGTFGNTAGLDEVDRKAGKTEGEIDRIQSCAGKGLEIMVVVIPNFSEKTATTYHNPTFTISVIGEVADMGYKAFLEDREITVPESFIG